MTGSKLIILAAFLFSPVQIQICHAQETSTPEAVQDSSLSDTLSTPSDSTRDEVPLDSIVTYSADHVGITFNPRITTLAGNAKVNYKSMELAAGKIEIHWDTNKLYAEPIPDTSRNRIAPPGLSDSSETDTSMVAAESPADSIKMTGRPKMTDGDRVIVGEKMTYDIKSRRGKVIVGKTDYEDGYYVGQSIKRMDATTYNISDGYYTTCDADEPHYGFWSSEMKLIVKDKVVVKPVVLQFGPVPVAILPYGVFPAHGGRHSGILVPTYGESGSQGRYFTGLGYYWAPNDYMDMRGSLDYYERYGILFRGDLNYAQRYIHRGSLSGSYVNQNREGSAQRRWDMKIDHSHTLSPSANLRVNAYFVSDNSYLRDVSQNQNERLKQTIRSDATLNKTWIGTPYSGSVNLHHEKDLSTGNIDQSLPRVSLTRSQSPIIAPPEGSKPDDARWWNKIYWRYGGSGINSSTTRITTLSDSSEQKKTRNRAGIQHSLGMTASTKPFEVFSFSPGISYTEAWFDEWMDYVQRENGIVDSVKQNSFRARRTFSASAGLSTKLYGMFHPGVFSLEAIRHTLSPSLSLLYVPDFGEAKWDYYESFRNALGTEVFYDRFAGNVFGGTPRREQLSLSMGIDNLFEYKRKVSDKEVKGELFSMGLSTSHNFKADSLKWGDLGGSIRIKPLINSTGAAVSGLGLDITTRHSFYAQREVAPESWVTIDKSAPSGIRLLGFDLTTSLKFQGGQTKKEEKRGADTTSSLDKEREDRFTAKTWQPNPLPWSTSIGLRYGETRYSPDNVVKNAWASVNIGLQATKNWKLSSDMRIDLINKNIASTGISLSRDLHCWEGRFTWNPVGAFSGYYLIIAIKSPHLKDVKVEKREGTGGFFGL